MSEDNTIQVLVPGPEWWIWAAFVQIRIFEPNAVVGWRMTTTPLMNGCKIETPIGSAIITLANNQTVIDVQAEPAHAEIWRAVLEDARRYAVNAHTIRRASIGPAIDRVLESYARAKESGSKVTLKELAESVGVSYSYVRKRKSQKAAKQTGNREGNKGNN